MKLNARDAARFLAKPDLSKAGVLLFGPDAMRIALKRQDVVATLVGPEGENEMRLTRMSGAELRKDPARLLDALKAQGFFPGQRVVLVEDATDGLSKTFLAAIQDWLPGDAMMVVTAGQLNARSALRKAFEGSGSCVAVGIYTDPPTRDEIEATLKKSGIANIDLAAMTDLDNLSRQLDLGDFRQTIEKLALYKLGDDTPVTSEDIIACAPLTSEAALDDAVNFAADGNFTAIVPQMRRLAGQGINPTTLCIGATRHFRQLHAAASSDQGPEAALSRARPPVFGPRRDRMIRQARQWQTPRLEMAIKVLTDTDLALRSSRPVPAMAMMERAFIRIAMLRPK
ncbi:DNA polymerase III subunit delta [Rhodobacterales bacterium 52_120_T64]|mgnify:FL=1|nr:DNA polymerase III subunit delta [Rhodobacterales bacterium 52_120_T64]